MTYAVGTFRKSAGRASQVSGSRTFDLVEIDNHGLGTVVKQKIAVLLLIMPLQALANAIGFDLTRAESPAFELDRISRSNDDPYTMHQTGIFQLQLPGILENPGFCALSQKAGCGIAALMVVVGDAGNASHLDITAAKLGPVTALEASATRVPLPGALGLFATGLLVLGAIRRKRPI